MTDLTDKRNSFEQLTQTPGNWLSSAQNLLAAADLMWASVVHDFDRKPATSSAPDGGHHADVAEPGISPPRFQHASVYLMLSGFAVESALKAVRVRQEGSALRLNRITHHDLHKLSTEAGVSLSTDDSELLERLRAFLTWAGRYPVATSYQRQQSAVQNIWSTDNKRVHDLFERIVERYNQT